MHVPCATALATALATASTTVVGKIGLRKKAAGSATHLILEARGGSQSCIAAVPHAVQAVQYRELGATRLLIFFRYKESS